MKIERILITEGLSSRNISFTDKVNIIHSNKNGCGKTTLLRFILYALGFSIPSTKGIKFDKAITKIWLYIEELGQVTLTRKSKESVQLQYKDSITDYPLPNSSIDLQKFLFRSQNEELIKNILGTIYIDQEKGWTLLNRGKVIGVNHFTIEELIRGLSGIDCTHLINKKNELRVYINKLKLIKEIAKHKEQLGSSLASTNFDDNLIYKINQLSIEKKIIKTQIRTITKSINENKQFGRYIEDLGLQIKTTEGNFITVTKDNIVGFSDISSILNTRKSVLENTLSKIDDKLNELNNLAFKSEQNIDLFNSKSFNEIFDQKISELPISYAEAKIELKQKKQELSHIEQQIDSLTKSNYSVLDSITNYVSTFANILQIDNKKLINSNYLFTKKLSELSGALLHKTIFAFKLGLVKQIEKTINVKLPIIIDSPRGGELDPDNAILIRKLLTEHFPNNQIIIASIYTLDFENYNLIELNNYLLEPLNNI